MSERIAIIGSRYYPLISLVREFVWELPPDAVVISGAAKGVDSTAAAAADHRHLSVIEYPIPHDGLEELRGDEFAVEYKRRAGERNQKIVDMADRLIAYWDGVSGGTLDAIRRARLKGIPIEIIGPKGYALTAASHPALSALWAATREERRRESA